MNRATARPRTEELPGPNAREWIARHRRVAAPSEHVHDFVWDLTADAEGPFVTDVDGNVLLDFTSHIGAAPLGYNNPLLLDRLAAFDLVDPSKIAGQDLYFAGGSPADPAVPNATELMERLVDASARYDVDTVFLSNSGAEAMENAIKVAHADRPGARHVIVFDGAFHGRTLGTLSLTRAKSVFTRDYPELSGTRTVPFCTDRMCTAARCDCGFFRADGSAIEALLHPTRGPLDPSTVAAIVVEPIQGVGGYRFPSRAFLAELERVRETYDVPLVVDEIQSGVGRSGRMWASEHFPIEPDIIVSAKALRVGATIGRSDRFPEEKNRLGSTWGGGDVVGSMLGALTLEAIEEHDLMANATERGRQFVETVEDADPESVVDVRGLGLLLAVEFGEENLRDEVVAAAVKRGLLLTGCGTSTVRVLPPLDVTEREIELGASILLEAIDAATSSSGLSSTGSEPV